MQIVEKFPFYFGSMSRLHSHCITGITSLYTADACATDIKPVGADFITSSVSSLRNAQNVRRHWLAAANEAARTAREPISQHSPVFKLNAKNFYLISFTSSVLCVFLVLHFCLFNFFVFGNNYRIWKEFQLRVDR